MGKHFCDSCGETYDRCACSDNPLAEVNTPVVEHPGEDYSRATQLSSQEYTDLLAAINVREIEAGRSGQGYSTDREVAQRQGILCIQLAAALRRERDNNV